MRVYQLIKLSCCTDFRQHIHDLHETFDSLNQVDSIIAQVQLRDGIDPNPLYGQVRSSDFDEIREVNGYYAGPLDP